MIWSKTNWFELTLRSLKYSSPLENGSGGVTRSGQLWMRLFVSSIHDSENDKWLFYLFKFILMWYVKVKYDVIKEFQKNKLGQMRMMNFYCLAGEIEKLSIFF